MKNPNLVGDAWIHSKQADNDSNPKFIEDEFELTYGQKTDQEFITAVANNAKANGETITLAGHSGGGLRNYLTLQNAEQNQFLDANGNSVLAVQFSGTPANYQDLLFASNKAGVGEVRLQNKVWNSSNPLADPVGIILGGNGNVFDATMAGVGSLFLFSDKSPHSSYGCILSNCASSQLGNPNLKKNSAIDQTSNPNALLK